MELETDSQQASSDISDEMRRAATMKQTILDPLHADITPDAPSDEFIANRHIAESPIANLPNDSETTRSASVPPDASKAPVATSSVPSRLMVAVALAGAVLIVLVMYLVIPR